MRSRFLGGEGSFSITDGGEDMYDTGNFISTNLLSLISYSNSVIRESEAFGAEGRYFTRKYPKLFLFAADMQGVEAFAITGNLGADDVGVVEGNVLTARANGIPYLGFVKRAFASPSPSVNHLVVVADTPGITHEFSTSTNSDFHVLTGLTASTRLYYLLFASRAGGYVDNETMQTIFQTFLRSLDFSNVSLDVSPIAGSIAPGQSAETTVTFDAGGLAGGVYSTDLAVVSNDPLQPSVAVAAELVVVGAPDIEVSQSAIDFGQILLGNDQQRTVMVRNAGGEPLVVEAIHVGDPAFTASHNPFRAVAGHRTPPDDHRSPRTNRACTRPCCRSFRTTPTRATSLSR